MDGVTASVALDRGDGRPGDRPGDVAGPALRVTVPNDQRTRMATVASTASRSTCLRPGPVTRLAAGRPVAVALRRHVCAPASRRGRLRLQRARGRPGRGRRGGRLPGRARRSPCSPAPWADVPLRHGAPATLSVAGAPCVLARRVTAGTTLVGAGHRCGQRSMSAALRMLLQSGTAPSDYAVSPHRGMPATVPVTLSVFGRGPECGPALPEHGGKSMSARSRRSVPHGRAARHAA